MSNLLWKDGEDWNFDLIRRTYDEIEKIGVGEYGLNIYQNQLEIVTSEQMIDAYTSIGMPMMYNHWSFGKHFSREFDNYKMGYRGLAYEMVINSNPCINYLMEENSMTMQALVMAHAAMGHNHFFKNNYLFKTWTDAETIVDYLSFAKSYIAKLEISEGQKVVEHFLDSCHALMDYGVNQYKHPRKLSLDKEKKKQQEREDYIQSRVDELYRIVPSEKKEEEEETENIVKSPEENILYFCEKYSPNLKPWQREVIRIVRKISQYFYPQGQTKVINEGTATYFHYNIFNRMYEKGLVSDAVVMEFISSHSGVVYQPEWKSRYYSGINPYTLGFEMFRDIERICTQPTEEDVRHFKDIIGENPIDVIKDAVEDYRDESFIRQYLSPKLMRDFKLFSVIDDREEDYLYVDAIQDDEGYETVKEILASSHEREHYHPKIEIIGADLKSRVMQLQYSGPESRFLNPETLSSTLEHVKVLWGGNPVVIFDKSGEVMGATL